VEEIVQDAYGWLAKEYREGDQIYLFGGFISLRSPDVAQQEHQVSLEALIKSGFLRG
jgi:hypothetical protein